jgi:hypothetical protein
MGLGGRIGLTLFFFVFFAMGTLFTVFMAREAIRALQSQSWPTVEAEILASAVETTADNYRFTVRYRYQHDRRDYESSVYQDGYTGNDSDDGTTYSVDILYRYEVNGREYRSNRYSFMGGSSSGYDGKAEVVRQYPPGQRATCYVNPGNPTDAVLVRGFTPLMWFGLLPLAFLLAGGFGLVHSASNPHPWSRHPLPPARSR